MPCGCCDSIGDGGEKVMAAGGRSKEGRAVFDESAEEVESPDILTKLTFRSRQGYKSTKYEAISL